MFISLYVLKCCSFVTAIVITITYFEPRHQASSTAQVPVLLWALPAAAKDLKSPNHFRFNRANWWVSWSWKGNLTHLAQHSDRTIGLEGRQEGLVGACWFFPSSAAAVGHVKESFCLSLPTLLSGYSITYLVGCFCLLTLSHLWWMLGGLCQAVLSKGKTALSKALVTMTHHQYFVTWTWHFPGSGLPHESRTPGCFAVVLMDRSLKGIS